MLKLNLILFFACVALSCREIPSDQSSGGIELARNDHSSAVLIESFIDYERKYFCVGVLISSNYVLTTARCVIGSIFVNIHVNAYKFFDVYEEGREIYRVPAENLIVKPNFDRYINHNDIALVQLPVTLNMTGKSYTTAKLPTSDLLPDSIGKSVGWGLYDFYDKDEYTTEVKNEILLKFISIDDCYAAYGARMNSTIGVAGRGCLNKMSGVNCVSGYGSPFFMNDNVVYALHSFGAYQYCTTDLYNGVTLIDSYHLPWIKAISDVI